MQEPETYQAERGDEPAVATDAVRHYRPPNGIPTRGDDRRVGLIGSLAVHLLLIVLALLPVAVATDVIDVPARLGGGAGPAGGGGGGRRGTGGIQERVTYLPISPEERQVARPRPPAPVPRPVVPPPTPKPVPQAEPKPVTPTPLPRPQPPPPQQPSPPAATPPQASAATPGEGGGSGSDGSDGSGPGSGGGVGSGIGTGRGSGVGPGTGGGPDSIYPPTLLTLALPPLQAPDKLRPYRLVALFDVDEQGRTTLLSFTQTSDSRFNRKVREVLGEVRFRPAVRADGTPVRDTGRFEIEYP